jgi:hypothetical protein
MIAAFCAENPARKSSPQKDLRIEKAISPGLQYSFLSYW